eukprot:maker-scaffold324_size206069-snap-gene-1.27 protein:Tk12286 transcript:maker-scaffold324_size206069-snap-gene-1.27-mRNA-1 annotation:"pre-mrna-processing factor 17"
MNSIVNYGSGSSSGEDSGDEDSARSTRAAFRAEEHLHLKPSTSSLAQKMELAVTNAAPMVQPNESMDPRRHIDPHTKEVKYNPKYEDLYAPTLGPENPHQSDGQKAAKNMLTGLIEEAHVSDFQFELQRKTFHSYGYAQDPSVGVEGEGAKMIGNLEKGEEDTFKTVFEDTESRPKDKRKRLQNGDAGDIEGFLGPWGAFEDEQKVAAPDEEDKAFLEEYLAKMKKRAKKQTDDKPIEEKTTLHIKDPYDYQGRSFLHIPQDVGVNLKSDTPPEKCFIPKRQIHTWAGHTKGVSSMQWFPRSGHLLLSSGMDSKIKLWEVYNNRRCVRTYTGHKMAVKGIDFNRTGSKFLSTSYDRHIKLWDAETGDCIGRFTNGKVGHCVKFNPDEDKQELFVVGTADKKILCWDIRSNEIVQEYDRHLGAVNTITFVDENRRFVTTSDDKSMRVWEWDIPVDMKYIADPTMHSMPAVSKSPNEKWLACQSLDNKICIFTCGEKFRPYKKKEFKGHMVAGYACQTSFSPEMSYLASGDGDGKVCIWDWKTTRMVAKWKAHDRTCISVLWHPHETSKLASAGWDGSIKYWD